VSINTNTRRIRRSAVAIAVATMALSASSGTPAVDAMQPGPGVDQPSHMGAAASPSPALDLEALIAARHATLTPLWWARLY
jgi:hypothetical protein